MLSPGGRDGLLGREPWLLPTEVPLENFLHASTSRSLHCLWQLAPQSVKKGIVKSPNGKPQLSGNPSGLLADTYQEGLWRNKYFDRRCEGSYRNGSFGVKSVRKNGSFPWQLLIEIWQQKGREGWYFHQKLVSRKRPGITGMILCMPRIKPLLHCMSLQKKVFWFFFLIDPAGPIIANTLGQKTLERPYSEPLEGQLEVDVDHCRLKLV